MEQNNTGIFIVGQLKGYFSIENGQYTNRFLAVITGSRQNEYGEQEDVVQQVEVSPKNHQLVEQASSPLIGKAVKVAMGVTHRKGEKNGRAWSFVKYYLRDTNIVALDNPKLKAAS